MVKKPNDNQLDAKYNFKKCEKEFSLWSVQKAINQKNLNFSKKTFVIVLPPPNVTGKLHLGHAWNVSIQDCLIRFNHLNGKNSYWICGMDHAGIATQTKYEKYLRDTKISNQNLSREKKINALYKWAQSIGDQIRQQWKNMGLFLDYENEHFTLDKTSSEVVNQVFVKMYNDGLIYKNKTLVNWDPILESAISNIEVIKKEKETNLYFIKYFFEASKEFLTVATTRPETIFVDECLVINPNDNRYQKYLDKKVINPLTKKKLRIITDEYVDLQFGTGVMKCTPAHDFNDYELGKKHGLNIISCFNKDGTTNEKAVGFENLKIEECRKKCVTFLEQNNLLVKVEKIVSSIGFSERTNAIVEPMVSNQWFVSVSKYAKKIIEIQKGTNKVQFYPQKFEKNLTNWLANINDWCISRQLWWGHQIPAWYKKTSSEIYVGLTPPDDENLYTRDNDVLDTWFSSGLWPISCSGILKNQSHLFPSDVLVTGFDIIFFWVFRMMFFSLYLTDKMPFKHCYITGLIRDNQNRKMSKSLGNGIDPNDVIEKYGADSLRLFLLSSAAPGEDICYSETKLASCWGFLNKLWNSFRFISKNSEFFNFNENQIPKKLANFDKWILSNFYKTYDAFIYQFKKYNFLIAIKKIVDFTWNDFCNNYLELTKNRNENKTTNLWVLNYLLKNLLVLLHPICPFITSKLYDSFRYNKKNTIFEESLNLVKISNLDENLIDKTLNIINKIRLFRFSNKIANNKSLEISIEILNSKTFELNSEIINILENCKIFVVTNKNKNQKPDIVENDFLVSIENKSKFENSSNDNYDFETVKKEVEKIKSEIKRCDSMLNNVTFMKKAPQEKIELESKKRKDYLEKLKKLEKILKG